MTNEKKKREEHLLHFYELSLALSFLLYAFLTFALMTSLWAGITLILQVRKPRLGKIKQK